MFTLPQTTFRVRACRNQNGFTLVETAMASVIITLFLLGSLFAMTRVNRYANVSRLQTMALAAAQERIDEILTTPWNGGTRTGVLVDGNPQTLETAIPLNNDTFNAATGLSSLYTDLDVEVTATRTTTVAPCSWAATGRPMIKANVTVSYTYRSRLYKVNLSTIRSSDTI